MNILIFEDQKASASLCLAIQQMQRVINMTYNPKRIQAFEVELTDLKNQYNCLKKTLNPDFVPELMKDIQATISCFSDSINESMKKINNNPVFGIRSEGGDLVRNSRLKLLYSLLFDELTIGNENLDHRHWIVWLNEIIENWSREVNNQLIQRSSHIHCSTSSFENLVEMCEVEAFAQFCDSLFFKGLVHEVRRGVQWVKENDPGLMTRVFEKLPTECTFAPTPAIPIERPYNHEAKT